MKTGQPETGTVLKKQIEYIYRRTKRMKSEVVILSCESYEEELVYSTLKKGIALLGGWETFLKKKRKDSAETKSGTKNGSGAGSHYPSGSGQRYRKTVERRRLCASELR